MPNSGSLYESILFLNTEHLLRTFKMCLYRTHMENKFFNQNLQLMECNG